MQSPDSIDATVKRIGDRIKNLRVEAGYSSYVDFAIRNDIQPKQYWKLEAGASNFTIRSLLRILEVHNITLEEFFKGVK